MSDIAAHVLSVCVCLSRVSSLGCPFFHARPNCHHRHKVIGIIIRKKTRCSLGKNSFWGCLIEYLKLSMLDFKGVEEIFSNFVRDGEFYVKSILLDLDHWKNSFWGCLIEYLKLSMLDLKWVEKLFSKFFTERRNFTWNQFWPILMIENWQFDNFEGFEIWFLCNFDMSLGRKLLKSQIRTSEIVKNTIFWALSLPKWPTLISGKFSKVEKFLWSVDFKKSQKCSIFFKKCQNSLLVSKRTHSWSLTTIDFLSACCVQFISTSKHGFFIKKGV